MAKKKPTVPLLSAFAWTFSCSGLLTFFANLFGLGGRSWVFPQVDSLPGLLVTSFVLFLLGMVPYLLQGIRKPEAS